jgi:hypothetical protein
LGVLGIRSAQLALALLLELTTEEMAVRWHQDVQWHVIAPLPRSDFVVDAQVIDGVIGREVHVSSLLNHPLLP